MPKVDLDIVKFILQRNELDVRKVSQIMDDIEVELTNQVDEERPPPVKKQFVMMVSDPEGELEGKNYTGWVLQIPEEDSPYVSEERLIKGAYEYNATKKGRRMPVKSVGEACEVVPARIYKEQNIWVKTKEPVLIVRSNNVLPDEMSDFSDLPAGLGGTKPRADEVDSAEEFVSEPIGVDNEVETKTTSEEEPHASPVTEGSSDDTEPQASASTEPSSIGEDSADEYDVEEPMQRS